MSKNKILGAWKLEKWYAEDTLGNLYYPLGEDAEGIIMYTADGYMSANLIAPSKTTNMTDGIELEKLHHGKGSYLSYSGSYTLYEDEVIHHVKVSLIPEWINNDQLRKYKIIDNKLIINSVAKDKNDTVINHTLIWSKCPAASNHKLVVP